MTLLSLPTPVLCESFFGTVSLWSVLTHLSPHLLPEVAILESDFLFRTVWKVAKYFFDPVTAAKVKTPTGSREDVKEKYFLEHFDEASLPEIYGGGLSHEDCGYYEYPSICEVNGIDIPKKKLSKKEKAADARGIRLAVEGRP